MSSNNSVLRDSIIDRTVYSNTSHSNVSSNDFRRGFAGSNSRLINYFTNSVNNNSNSNIYNNTSVCTEEEKDFAALLWGTNFDVNEVEKKIIDFITTYSEVNEDDSKMKIENVNDDKYYYINKLNEIKETEVYFININAQHIKNFDTHLYSILVFYPAETIMFFDQVLNKLYKETILTEEERNNLENVILSRVVNLCELSMLRALGPKDINHLISIKGIIIRVSNIIPEMKDAHFKCLSCGAGENVLIDRGRIHEPSYCKGCNDKGTLELIHNMSTFTDKQYIKLQETPENVPEGDTPNYVTLIVYDDLVDICRPGDRVNVTGIFRVQGIRISREKNIMKNVFRNYIDVISVIQENNNFEDNFDIPKFNEEEVTEFVNFSKKISIYDDLLSSFAPMIWENEHVKLGLLCQLFGGSQKLSNNNESGRSNDNFRSDINILLVGDPSTAKSQLLKFTHAIHPRGIYTSGKGSSAVGLTASISRDPETKEIVLQSGALILSDKGICCIDEFDKMDDSTKTILHEVMEQQTISIAKAGIVCTLNARAAILAAANPKESKYNPKKSIIYNLETPPSLISRFDLIYLMLDKKSEENDKKLAMHILSLYSENGFQNNEQSSVLTKKFLSRYVSYARLNCSPKLSKEACGLLSKYYLEMREMGINKNIITATPRQLESMIRISESIAKMRLSEFVNEDDVNKAYDLIKEATQKSALDPSTGLIDMNKITTGFSSTANTKIKTICETIKELLIIKQELYVRGVKSKDLLIDLKEKLVRSFDTIDKIEMNEALKLLEDESLVIINGDYRREYIIKLPSSN